MNYRAILEELISLLEKAAEQHWVKYFTEALNLYETGNSRRSYKQVLRAYGGMGSFNDIALNFISDDEYSRVGEIQAQLWSYCKENKGFF